MWNESMVDSGAAATDGAAAYENGNQQTSSGLTPDSRETASPAVSERSTQSVPAAEPVQYYEQDLHHVVVGPGGLKEAILLGVYFPKLNSRQKDELSRAKKYGMEQSIKAVLMKQTVQHQQQQQKLAMYAQAMSLMARVYIGSISFELREETVKSAFLPFGPIKSINMSWDSVTGHHKGFAFLEYEVPESATLAQEQMNGILIGGRNIKVGRPSNMPQAQPIIESIMEEAKLHHRVYVSSIHADLTEQDIKSVFEAFGTIISVELPKGLQGKHKGFAYINFDNEKSALDAVASMNLFDLGGQFLRVGRAITPSMVQTVPISPAATLPTAAAVAAAAVTAKIQSLDPTVSPPISSPDLTIAQRPGRTLSPATAAAAIPPPGVAIPSAVAPSQPCLIVPILHSVPVEKDSALLPSAAVETTAAATTATGSLEASRGSPVNMAPPPPPPLQVNSQPAAAVVASTDDAAQRLLQTAESTDHRQAKMVDPEAAQTLAAQEDLKIKGNEARNVLMHKLMRRFESRVMVLRNMVGPEDVDESLQEEVTEECARFGNVEQVVIYQEQIGDAEDAPTLVKVFVKYSNVQEAEKAKDAFDGRYFSGRQIKAELYDQTMFDLNDLSG